VPRMLHWSSLAVLVAGLLSVGPAGIRAQDSTVVCLPSFEWMGNSRSQNPCVVAAYLQAACTGGQFTVAPLPVGSHYTGPYADESNPCQCSTVTYSMISACGLCQNSSIISWTSWDFNCTTLYVDIFPPGVPAGTAVPYWAYQNVTAGGTFNVTLAQSLGDNPEATATAPQSTASVISTSTSPFSISSSPSSSVLPAGSSSSQTNVGAIAGGVVGGVVGIALIAAVVVFFVMKKRRSQIPPSAQFAGHPPSANPSNGYAPQPAPPGSPYSPQMTQPKLYDPSDPSTFPVSPSPPTTMTGSTVNAPTSFVTYSSNYPSVRPGTGGAYTGAPEV